MRLSKPILVIIALLTLVWSGCHSKPNLSQPPAVIFLVRHAEKVTDGSIDLSTAGQQRAQLLARAFSESGSQLPTPQALFAAHLSAHSNRSLQTLTPLATALHLPVDDSFRDEDFAGLAAALLSGKYSGKVVLVAWHRGKLPQLAAALGAKPPYAVWPQEQYDRMWRIDYADGKAVLQELPYPTPSDSAK
jgi:hypothetical protein